MLSLPSFICKLVINIIMLLFLLAFFLSILKLKVKDENGYNDLIWYQNCILILCLF